jgi:hypothetical protein
MKDLRHSLYEIWLEETQRSFIAFGRPPSSTLVVGFELENHPQVFSVVELGIINISWSFVARF